MSCQYRPAGHELDGLADELYDMNDSPSEYAKCLLRTENVSLHNAASRAHNRYGGGYDAIYAEIEREGFALEDEELF